MTRGGHPVGREPDRREGGDGGRDQVGDRLGHRHAPGGRGVQQGQRGALTQGHRLPGEAAIVAGGHRAIGDGHLPGADHLVACHQAGDAAVADGDEEGLVGHGRQGQDPGDGLVQVDRPEVERGPRRGHPLHVAVHPRRLAEQGLHGQVDGRCAELRIGQRQVPGLDGLPDHGIGTALAFADRLEGVDLGGVDGQDIALLGLVAPDLQGRQAGLGIGDAAQLEAAAPLGVVDQFGQGVGEAAGAHVVDEEDGVGLAARPAAVDDLLAAALHLRVGPLDRGEVQVLGRGPAGHAGGRAATQPDQHRRTTEDHQRRPRREGLLGDVLGTDVADAPRQHDGLMVAAQLRGPVRSRDGLLVGAEVAGQVGPAELVVEGGGADGALEHDLQGRADPPRSPVVLLPGPLAAREAQVGDREAA